MKISFSDERGFGITIEVFFVDLISLRGEDLEFDWCRLGTLYLDNLRNLATAAITEKLGFRLANAGIA